MNVFVVIPTIRTLNFLDAWKGEFENCHLIVIEDHPTKQIITPTEGFRSIVHYTWNDIRNEFGDSEWIFSRQNAGIRSYGFWKAYNAGADAIITLDDDCYPAEQGFVQKHLDNLASKAPDAWFTTFPHPDHVYTRGFPYNVRNKHRVVISHGLWSNKMDMDAKTQLRIGEVNVPAYPPIRQHVPFGYYFPMSSMNLAFTREVAPLMYFPLMGKDPQGRPWGHDRYDDIWAGIFVKKILDHLGLAVVNGSPFVEHRKASNPNRNLEKEKNGMRVNESLWKRVEAVNLSADTLTGCYKELIDAVDFPQNTYFVKLKAAMNLWTDGFV